jgi:hypothetical protein
MPPAGRFVRDHAFLVAAAALPIVVVLFFLLSTIVPQYTVAAPDYDLLLSASAYGQPQPRVGVTFAVRDGQLYATALPDTPKSYPLRTTLWIFDRSTLGLRPIAVDLPDLGPDDAPQTFLVPALAGRRVLAQTTAPDGYELRSSRRNSPGLVGELFGMHSHGEAASLVKNGRVIPIDLPPPYESQAPTLLGWLVDGGRR